MDSITEVYEMKKSEKIDQPNSRRRFLKGSLMAGVAGVVASSTSAAVSAVAQSEPAKEKTCTPKHSWEIVPDPIPASKITQSIEADIVVVGAGVAGVFAAHAAAENGAKAIVLEKFKTFSCRAKDNGAVNTKLHSKEDGTWIDEERLLEDLFNYYQNRTHQSLMREFVYKSGKIMNHYIDLCEANGVSVTLLPGYEVSRNSPGYATAHNFFLKDQAHSSGSEYVPTQVYLMRVVEKHAKELGAEFRYNTAAEQLIRDKKSGRVTGVVARTKTGYIQFNARKAVIMATGGYTENKEMLEAWGPSGLLMEVPCYTPVGGNMGEGIAMSLWAGASLQRPPFPVQTHTIPAPVLGNDLMVANQTLLHINKLGLRYENENQPDPLQSNGRVLQPGKKAWSIFDSRYYKDQAPIKTSQGGPVNEPQSSLDESVAKGLAFKADTIEELAQKIGVPASTLKKTVDRYTELAKKGKDEDFGKPARLMFPITDAPFYALPIKSQLLVTLGSLNCDPNMQVLDTNDEPIPGFYAIGNMMGNYFGEYPMFAPGFSSGRCIVMSHILAERLAKA
jgi:fumarate reductase flavoprotein subunit